MQKLADLSSRQIDTRRMQAENMLYQRQKMEEELERQRQAANERGGLGGFVKGALGGAATGFLSGGGPMGALAGAGLGGGMGAFKKGGGEFGQGLQMGSLAGSAVNKLAGPGYSAAELAAARAAPQGTMPGPAPGSIGGGRTFLPPAQQVGIPVVTSYDYNQFYP